MIRNCGCISWVIVAYLFLGCNRIDQPRIITLSKPANYRPSSPEEIHDIESVLAAIVTVSRDDLKISPTIGPIQVYLYKDTQSFSAAVAPHTNRDVTRMAALAIKENIHANLEVIKDIPWGEQIWVWAHEYGHVLHYSLGGEKVNWLVWFSEGFAEWFAAQVVNNLGWQDYSTTIHRTNLELKHHMSLLPPLSALREGRGWTEISRQPRSWARTYSLAFFAVAKIVDKHGTAAILKYLASGDFNEIFGELQDKFEANFLQSLDIEKHPNQMLLAASKPDWKVGYHWTYNQKRYGFREEVSKILTRTDRAEDIKVYVVKVGREEYFYAENSMGLAAIKKDEHLVSRVTNPHDSFLWPLVVNRKWRHTFDREEFERKLTQRVDREMVVTGTEKVKVSAGQFDVVKIDGYGYNSGRLLVEYWYSPTVKWFVKTRLYRPAGVSEDELVSFKVT